MNLVILSPGFINSIGISLTSVKTNVALATLERQTTRGNLSCFNFVAIFVDFAFRFFKEKY